MDKKNFVSDRKYLVKLKDYFTRPYSLDNGTAQGSALSPLLFLIMINDFPKLSRFTSEALFADDCTIWRSGNNILQIMKHLQDDLKLIETWCKEWGFVINTSKTIGIVFSNKGITINPTLKINDRIIEFKSSCKILGVAFDSRLSWMHHIQDVRERISPRLNLMRSLTGVNWGASKSTLLIIYKAWIRSILDYNCWVYRDAAKSNLRI